MLKRFRLASWPSKTWIKTQQTNLMYYKTRLLCFYPHNMPAKFKQNKKEGCYEGARFDGEWANFYNIIIETWLYTMTIFVCQSSNNIFLCVPSTNISLTMHRFKDTSRTPSYWLRSEKVVNCCDQSMFPTSAQSANMTYSHSIITFSLLDETRLRSSAFDVLFTKDILVRVIVTRVHSRFIVTTSITWASPSELVLSSHTGVMVPV